MQTRKQHSGLATVATALMIALSFTTFAQEPALEILPPTLNIQPADNGEQDPAMLIRRLLDEVKQSRKNLQQAQEDTLPPAEIDQFELQTDQTRVFAEIDHQIRDWDRDRKERIDVIEMKVRQLSELLKHRRETPPPPKPLTQPVEPAETKPPKQAPADSSTEEPAAEPAEPVEPLPQPITDSAVDHLALADSLFGAAKTKLALGVYQNIQQEELTAEERGWVVYQIAVCQRKLGQVAEAEKHFRMVAGMTALPRLPSFARWQLDAIARMKELSTRADKTRSAIETIQTRIEATASAAN